MVFLQSQLGVEPYAEPPGGLCDKVVREPCFLDARGGGGVVGFRRFLRLLRRIASVFSVSKVTALASAQPWAVAAARSKVSLNTSLSIW